jgi:hypothetical protein
MPIPEVRVIALQSKAVPEAPRLGRLRCRNADEERNRAKGAENELHRVFSSCRYAKENDAPSQTILLNQTDQQQGSEETIGQSQR